mgnify:FL=1
MTHGATLSPKQITFCAFVASGETQTDAYLKSYNAKKMTRKMASTEASKLMKKGKVKDRVDQLKADATVSKNAVIGHDRDWIVQQVTQIVADEESRNSDKLRALEILAKIRGLFDDSTQVVVEHRTSGEVREELQQKLSTILGAVN